MKIAVVGCGISGITAAYLLRTRHDVRLFEAQPRAGGHAHTVEIRDGTDRIPVDTGFIVFNDRTYPNFERLLNEWGVAWQPSDMSFSVSSVDEDFEYNGTDLNGLFAQRRNVFRPRFYKMLFDILRFNKSALNLLADQKDVTLGQFLQTLGVGDDFLNRYLLPMGAAIWSTPLNDMRQFDARQFVQFFAHHGLLQVSDRPQWRVIKGGSKAYVDKALAILGSTVQVNAAVQHVVRHADRVSLTVDGREQSFDAVVLACHSDEALAILADPSAVELSVLSAIPYESNDVVLHTDKRLMPRRKKAWASWNYRAQKNARDAVQVTYWMNLLQALPGPTDYFVSLNMTPAIDPKLILGRYSYAHPRFGRGAVAAQGRWQEISGQQRTHFCGAYWRNGFHEDGAWSGARVAKALGVNW